MKVEKLCICENMLQNTTVEDQQNATVKNQSKSQLFDLLSATIDGHSISRMF